MRLLVLLMCMVPVLVFGGYSQVSGKWSPDKYVPVMSMQEHYDLGYQQLYENEWDDAMVNFMVIVYHFPESPFYGDSLFYTGVCYYHKGEYDLSNKQFDKYIDLGGKLKHFEKVFDFKLEIANAFSQGKRKHMFGMSKLPKIAPARKDALSLYDEVIAALPAKDVAASALYMKADLLNRRNEFRESIEALQTLSRRFPKHTLAADSYLKISEIYLTQSERESQNPDLIALAHINLQKFARAFPSDQRLYEAESKLIAMQEIYAQSLYETGRFYERKKKPFASKIYYEDAIRKYPATIAASKSRDRIEKLKA